MVSWEPSARIFLPINSHPARLTVNRCRCSSGMCLQIICWSTPTMSQRSSFFSPNSISMWAAWLTPFFGGSISYLSSLCGPVHWPILTFTSIKSPVAVEIPILSHKVLAEMVGTTRPRVNLFMNRFKRRGFINYNGRLEVHQSLRKVLQNR